jgi:hypothetical protein
VDKSEWQDKGEGHRQRLRDKFLARGSRPSPTAEIIELLLTFGTPRSRLQGGGAGGSGEVQDPARCA